MDYIPFSLKKERDSDTWYNVMSLEEVILSEIAQTNNVWFNLYEVSRVVKIKETENWTAADRGEWGASAKWQFQFGKLQKLWRWMVVMVTHNMSIT